MDSDLMVYFDERFREASQQAERRHEETLGRLDRLGSRVEKIEVRLERVEARLGEFEAGVGGLEVRLDRLEGQLDRVEESVRHARIEIEGLRGELRLVAEAFIGGDEKLASFRVDMAKEFSEVRSSIRLPFEYLDSRLRIIEVRADNVNRDVMDLVREKLGKPAPSQNLL